jgi:hypothetical protein
VRRRVWMTVVLTMALALVAESAGAATFTTPLKLTGPAGGEPSIATDGSGNVYVDGPQGIPSGANDQAGVGFWASHDNAASFGPGSNLGSFLGGGDSDVVVAPDASVYIDDLEAVAAAVCKSTDHGKTFDSVGPLPDPDHCTHIGQGQVGPSDDRPWLTTDPHGAVYLTYHEFVTAQPLIFRTDNGGGDLFTAGPCGSIVTDPAIEANVPTDITGGTLVAKPVTDSAGNLYVLFTTTTQQQNTAALAAGQPSGSFSQLYLAVSHDHCQTFTDHTVFDGSKLGTNSVQFGDIFNAITTDGAGNLYTIGTGFVGTNPFSPTANVYLFSSADQGQTWKGPTLIGATSAAHSLPAAVGGPSAGQLSVGYFQTTNGVTDPNSTSGKWTYTTAQSANATAAAPAFSYADVNPGVTYHNGEICNQGILCGTVPGQASDRSLLDFTSATIDPAGCPLFTFAGNPTGSAGNNTSANTFNYVTRQLTGCFTPPASSTQPGGASLLTPIVGAPGSGGHRTLSPSTSGCVAARRLTFRLNRIPRARVVRAVVYVNGHRVKSLRAHSITRISFARPRGALLRVRIVTISNRGRRSVTLRTFRSCAH